jgi:hypothetical protein
MEMFIHLMERHLKRNFKKSEKNLKMILCQACKSGNMELFNPKSPTSCSCIISQASIADN